MASKYKGEQKIRRFGYGRITEHLVLIVTFSILVITGLSQKFYGLDLSNWLVLKLGGIDDVRFIHRFTGLAFVAITIVHIAVAVTGVVVRKWQPTMLITRKDFSDVWHNLRYYVGLDDSPAMCGRYDYKEKFIYWVVLIGAVLMSATGLSLWFPISVVTVLPGVTIPLAKALHSNEALLIFLIIAVWHIYDSIFSPDVFPFDTSIFSGYIDVKRMKRLHPLELSILEGKNPEEITGGSDASGKDAEQPGPAPD